MLGSMLVPGVWYSVPTSIGISVCETYWKKYKLLPIVGGALMGMLSGFLIALFTGGITQNSIFGFLFGGGIALSVILGRRFSTVLQIPIWVFASAFLGWAATRSAVTGDTVPFIVVSVGIAVAIGLVSSYK
jgi:ABC-type Mn2+/Zn2+ transport system permease subunit